MLSIVNGSDFNVSHGLFVVKFWATWCQPCKVYAPTIEKLDLEFDKIEFLSIDADQVPEVVKNYKIRSLPTLLVLADGQEIDRITGVQLIEPLRSKLRAVIESYSVSDDIGEQASDVAVSG